MRPAPKDDGRDGTEEARLLQAARHGDDGARERVVAARLDLVHRVASRYLGLGLSLDDLVQEGCIGLLDAIDRYDPGRHVDFAAFARFRVRRAIRNALTEQARLIRLPKHVVARRRLLARAEAELTARRGRAPTAADLAGATGLAERDVVAARAVAGAPLSLDGDGAAAVLPESDGLTDPLRKAIAAERARLLRAAVDGLSLRRRQVIHRRYGLDGGETAAAVVARDLHVSERRTRTIEREALDLLARTLDPHLREP